MHPTYTTNFRTCFPSFRFIVIFEVSGSNDFRSRDTKIWYLIKLVAISEMEFEKSSYVAKIFSTRFTRVWLIICKIYR